MRVEPVGGCFGATVHGVTIPSIGATQLDAVREAWIEFGLLIFPSQFLTPHEQNDFARRFGELEVSAFPLTNIAPDGSVMAPDSDPVTSLLGNEGWHHDSTFMPLQAKGAVFSAEIIPSHGGATEFADTRAAYDRLDDAERTALNGLAATHSRRRSMERARLFVSAANATHDRTYGFHDGPAPLRPIVKVHPDTGRPNLTIGQHAFDVVGMTDADSTELLGRLNAHTVQLSLVHRHEWSVGDTVLWDNRRLMHRATPYDLTERRRMWHTRIAGDPATETALNYAAV
jgi:alpha-ketoglutarate-dependent taurine dioxygenase